MIVSKNSLWNDPDYQNAICRCTDIAHEDYKFTDLALQKTEITLNDLRIGIQKKLEPIWNKTNGNARAETAKEVAKQLQTTKQSLEGEIAKKIDSVRESLDAKQRALNHFSIAFMGKTKTGKSTLHAIITGEGWDAIGVTEGKIKIDCPVLSQQFTPEEILAQIFRQLVDDASQNLDKQVTQVVLTVPAYFDEIQRHAVKEAGRLAGLEVLHTGFAT